MARFRRPCVRVHSQLTGGWSSYPSVVVDKQWYDALCALVLQCIDDVPSVQLAVILVDADTIRLLNKQYRKFDRITDVLSFAYHERGTLESGEIYLCPSQAMRQRARFHTTKKQELARLFFHGLLHILGYDHVTPIERKRMRNCENCLMRSAEESHLC